MLDSFLKNSSHDVCLDRKDFMNG